MEASTAAINKQCQSLEAQKQALQALKGRHGSNDDADQAQALRQKKLAREKAQLEFEVGELADVLQTDVRSAMKEADSVVSGLPTMMERILEKDDRLLDGLQKLLPRLSDTEPTADVEMEVDKLCQALSVLSAQEIRSRTDATYIADVGSPSPSDTTRNASARKQIDSLRAELSELCSEIDGLATMAVDSHYRLPIVHELKSAEGDSELDKAKWSDYVMATLQYLTTRLETLDEHAHHLHVYQGALKQVGATFESVLAVPAAQKLQVQQPSRSPSTPVAKRLKPLRLVQANFSEPQEATSQLLRAFDIRVSDPSDTAKLSSLLDEAVQERQDRLTELGTTTERAISDQLAETIANADRDVLDLMGAVFAQSKYGTVRLVDEEMDSELEGLEEKTQMLGEEMRGLGVEGIVKEVRRKQKAILQRS